VSARPAGGWGRRALRYSAMFLLAAWTGCLIAVAVQLEAWSDSLSRTLLQIRADAVFRTRMVEAREPIPREWYRSKALALLEASESLHDDSRWAIFVPGSWPRFDNLKQRAAARIERAFNEIAVETMRRELYFRASELTGVPQDSLTAELLPGAGCAPPALNRTFDSRAAVGGGQRGSPQLIAVQEQLAALHELDRAVQALVALHGSGDAHPEHLRLLVRYTLGVELPGQLSRSVALFRSVLKPDDLTFASVGVPSLQQASRCSIAALMKALDARVYERDPLLAAEDFLAQRAVRLFAPAARPGPYGPTVQAYREVIAALDEQEALLAKGDYAWLRQASAGLGPTHESLLARIGDIGLLGPQAADQVRRQSAASQQRFRRQFGMVFGAGSAAGLQWQAEQGRLVLSPQRTALRDALAALLQEPFMTPPADHAIPESAAAPLSWDTGHLQQALSLAEVRRQFATRTLPAFPPAVRRSIGQFVQAHLAQQLQDVVVEAMRPAPEAGAPPTDAAAYRLQRDHLAKVQALFSDFGARDRADRLRALVAHDLVERLALAEERMWRSSIYTARLQHFGWWQGDTSAIHQAFGVTDNTTLRYLVAQQFNHFDEVGREAGLLLEYVDASTAAAPAVQRWQGMVAELKRYRAAAPDSSLLALERYLLWLGGDLYRANCLEKLWMAAPNPARADEFALRHGQIHRALLGRCAELRGAAYPASAPVLHPRGAPFG
jgi:type VI secretion system protein ImpL